MANSVRAFNNQTAAEGSIARGRRSARISGKYTIRLAEEAPRPDAHAEPASRPEEARRICIAPPDASYFSLHFFFFFPFSAFRYYRDTESVFLVFECGV